jgi:hypothetical protein
MEEGFKIEVAPDFADGSRTGAIAPAVVAS